MLEMGEGGKRSKDTNPIEEGQSEFLLEGESCL